MLDITFFPNFKQIKSKSAKPRKVYKDKPIPVKNPKIGAHIAMMHEKWLNRQKNPVAKTPADPLSISSIKQERHCTRHQARLILERINA